MVADATTLEAAAVAAGDERAKVKAMWARGHALRELGQMSESAKVLGAAIEKTTGDLAERIRTSLALTTFLSGDTDAALDQLEQATEALEDPAHRARAEAQKGLILARIGRLEEALAILDDVDEAACDLTTRAQVLGNRGITAALLGRIAPAESDLERAREIARELGQVVNEARARHNLAFVSSLKGDLVRAIAEYRDVAELVVEAGYSAAEVESDLAEVLLGLGLVGEAAETAQRAALRFTQDGRVADAAEANLLLARALFAGMRLSDAATTAESVSSEFASQARPGWKQAADAVSSWCRWAGDDAEITDDDIEDAIELAGELHSAGWVQSSYRTLLMVGRAALKRENRQGAGRVLEAATPPGDDQPPSVETMWHHIDGLRHELAGDIHGAHSRYDAGIAVVDRFRTTLGATELRSLAASLSQDLAEDGLRLALTRDDPDLAMEWIERDRAASMWHPPVIPPEDSRVVELLVQLRKVAAELTGARLDGQPVDELVQRRRQLEDAAAEAMWGLDGETSGMVPPRLDPDAVGRRLDGRSIAIFGSCSGRFVSVAQVGDERTITDHGPLDPIRSEIRHVSMTLRRLAAQGLTPSAIRDLRGALDFGLERLDGLLAGPLPALIGGGGIVVVPTGPLHRLPVSLLPSWRGWPITIAPSVGIWARRKPPSHPRGRAVFVAGPGLTHAETEVADLAAQARKWGDRDVVELVGDAATVDSVRGMMDGADLIHIAAHGRFREEHPSFSSVELADGGLTLHDLAYLGAAPRHVVLSACDAGIHAVTGRDLTGLGATFLGAGTESLVASLAPLPDDLAREAMIAYHVAAGNGLPQAEALAEAITAVRESHPLGFLASSLTLMGSV